MSLLKITMNSILMECKLYKFSYTPLDKGCAKLLEKVYQTGGRAHVLTEDEAQTEALTTSLWTYHPRSFLPHGTQKDGWAEDQPIWISSEMNAQNKATYIVLYNYPDVPAIKNYAHCIDMFSGNDIQTLGVAKKRYQYYKTLTQAEIVCWFQNEKGDWQRSNDEKSYFEE